MIKGIIASPGIAIGKAYIMDQEAFIIEKKFIDDPKTEIDRLQQAITKTKEDIQMIQRNIHHSLSKEDAAIFEAHLLIADDPDFIQQVKQIILDEKVNTEYALTKAREHLIDQFNRLDDDYMKERINDIYDVTNRMLANLIGREYNRLTDIFEDVILIADDLTPSETAQVNSFVKGFITNRGSRISHSAIMSRSLNIPAIVGTKTITQQVQHDDLIIVDAINNKIYINPTTKELSDYQKELEKLNKEKERLQSFRHLSSVTTDGHKIKLMANIGSINDLDVALHNGSEGIGLFRTEFLYLGRQDLPSEEEQFHIYKTVLEAMQGKPVVIRTLDIGGDKQLPYLQIPKEMNPFLGYRGIRLTMDRKDIFKSQLRALLRASNYGNLKIMFPMIATIEEFEQAKAYLNQIKQELINEGLIISDSIEVGMMIEVPASALLAHEFAKIVDFFSIGTNDLIQYLFAVDRMNEQVSYLYQPYHPSLLMLIEMVVNAAQKENKSVGICGEMAADPFALPLLLGLGIDELSMSPPSILTIRKKLRQLTYSESIELKNNAIRLRTNDEVINLLNDYSTKKLENHN